jgi:hypothetical protein
MRIIRVMENAIGGLNRLDIVRLVVAITVGVVLNMVLALSDRDSSTLIHGLIAAHWVESVGARRARGSCTSGAGSVAVSEL